jgi:hypothetical protein
MTDEVRIYPSRRALLLHLLGALAFVLVGLWIRGIIGSIAICFFGLCAVYLLFRLVVRRPALVIGQDGIARRRDQAWLRSGGLHGGTGRYPNLSAVSGVPGRVVRSRE